MFTEEESVTPEIFREASQFEGLDSDAMLPENIADGLNALKGDSFQPNAIETPQPETSKPMFVLPHWYKAYAEALLAVDLALPALISWAEMEIRIRHLTAFSCPIEADESRDLNHAVEVLSQLKKASTTVLRYGIAGRKKGRI